MRKSIILIILFSMLILLAACTAPAAVELVDESPEENSEVPVVSEPEAESEVAQLSMDAITPAETAAEAGILRDRDWTKGAEEPLITIIEYGDFQ